MRKLNCRAGDLAIIVDAFTSDNIGMIVKVLGKHRNRPDRLVINFQFLRD